VVVSCADKQGLSTLFDGKSQQCTRDGGAGRQVLWCLFSLTRVVCCCDEAIAFQLSAAARPCVQLSRQAVLRPCSTCVGVWLQAGSDRLCVCVWPVLLLSVVGPSCDVFPVQRALQHSHCSAQDLAGLHRAASACAIRLCSPPATWHRHSRSWHLVEWSVLVWWHGAVHLAWVI
jgi:hypothetical protein